MKKAIDIFRKIEWFLLVVPMAFLILAVVVEVCQRAIGFKGFAWLEEFSRYVFVFCTFLGASLAVETDGHAKVTAVLVAVPKKVAAVMEIVGNLFCAGVCAAVTYYGFIQITKQMASGATATALPIPMYVPYLIIPLAMVVSAIRYLCLVAKTAGELTHKREEQAAEEGRT